MLKNGVCGLRRTTIGLRAYTPNIKTRGSSHGTSARGQGFVTPASKPPRCSLLKSITIILHPERQFWVIPHPPLPPAFAWPSILAHYSL